MSLNSKEVMKTRPLIGTPPMFRNPFLPWLGFVLPCFADLHMMVTMTASHPSRVGTANRDERPLDGCSLCGSRIPRKGEMRSISPPTIAPVVSLAVLVSHKAQNWRWRQSCAQGQPFLASPVGGEAPVKHYHRARRAWACLIAHKGKK